MVPRVLTPTEVANLAKIARGYKQYPGTYKDTVLHYSPLAYWRLGEIFGCFRCFDTALTAFGRTKAGQNRDEGRQIFGN